MPKKRKAGIPRFRTEAEERAYWQRTDSVPRVDWSAARRVMLANLRPSAATIEQTEGDARPER